MEFQPLPFFGHAAFIFWKVFLKYIAVILELHKFIGPLRQKVQIPRAFSWAGFEPRVVPTNQEPICITVSLQ